MVDFISEVQEELRKDDYNLWLKKYGPYLAALIVLIVAGTALFQWREYRAEQVSESTSYDYIEVVDSIGDDKTGAVAKFTTLSQNAPDGYAGISLLRAAELELENGNKEKAVAFFDDAATKFSKKRHIQLAQLKAGYILAGLGKFEDVKSRIEPLTQKDEPYQYLARELMAYAAQETNDLKTARMHLSYIETSPGAPESIVRRAKQNLLILNTSASDATTAPTETEMTSPAEPGDDTESAPTETEENE